MLCVFRLLRIICTGKLGNEVRSIQVFFGGFNVGVAELKVRKHVVIKTFALDFEIYLAVSMYNFCNN